MPLEQNRTRPENILIYDEECFFCSNYVRLLNLKATIGDIVLINARDKQALGQFHFTPVNLNEGILLILGDKAVFRRRCPASSGAALDVERCFQQTQPRDFPPPSRGNDSLSVFKAGSAGLSSSGGKRHYSLTVSQAAAALSATQSYGIVIEPPLPLMYFSTAV